MMQEKVIWNKMLDEKENYDTDTRFSKFTLAKVFLILKQRKLLKRF